MLYIYLTTNKINGKKYIGQHKGEINDNYLGSGIELKLAIKKYGKENFKKEILCICKNQEDLDLQEKKFIEKYDAVKSEDFYNIAEGGRGGNKCAGLSKEEELNRRKKISEAMKGKKNPFYGKGFKKEEHPLWGKHHREESKEKMRKAKRGKTLTEEHKKKISLNSKFSIPIDMYDINNNYIKTFRSKREVNIFLGLSPNSTYRLSQFIKENKVYHNYIFKESHRPVSTILGSEE